MLPERKDALMSFRKYAGDYGLENVPGKSGKLKTVAVYKGADYVLESTQEDVRSAKPYLGGCVIIFWLAQLGALSMSTYCARCMWVSMPQAFSLLAFGFATVGVWMLLRAKNPMTREYAERMRDRFTGGSFMAMLLGGAALIGGLLAAALSPERLMLPQDVFYLILLALALAAAVFCFVRRNILSVRVSQEKSE